MAYTEADKRYKRSPVGKAASASYFQRLSPEQREQRRNRERAWRKANPDKARVHNKWSKVKLAYGLSRDQWECLFRDQGYVCAGCGADTSGSSRGWATDHSHATGAVRGILCLQCNVILGMAKDDPNHLRSLARYLEVKGESGVST